MVVDQRFENSFWLDRAYQLAVGDEAFLGPGDCGERLSLRNGRVRRACAFDRQGLKHFRMEAEEGGTQAFRLVGRALVFLDEYAKDFFPRGWKRVPRRIGKQRSQVKRYCREFANSWCPPCVVENGFSFGAAGKNFTYSANFASFFSSFFSSRLLRRKRATG